MTLYLPDISAYQPGINLTGWKAVAIKITESTRFASSQFGAQLTEASHRGAWPIAYHFLHAGNPAGQAAYCLAQMRAHSATSLPLMLDVELTTAAYRALAAPGGTEGFPDTIPPEAVTRLERVTVERTVNSLPQVGDITAFIDAYRAGGGTCHICYLPRWYWSGHMRSVSLAPLAARGVGLWSSAYTTYTDAASGTGWQPYGGITPTVWQYTSTMATGGYKQVDCSAFRGTLEQLKTALTGGGGGPPAGTPTISSGATGPAVIHLQQRLNAWGAVPLLTVDGAFGTSILAAVMAFQRAHALTADGVVGPATWTELDKTPPGGEGWQAKTPPPGTWQGAARLTGTGADGKPWHTVHDGNGWATPAPGA